MTIKEAVLKSLEDIGEKTNYLAVYEHIIAKKYYDFKDARTPALSIDGTNLLVAECKF